MTCLLTVCQILSVGSIAYGSDSPKPTRNLSELCKSLLGSTAPSAESAERELKLVQKVKTGIRQFHGQTAFYFGITDSELNQLKRTGRIPARHTLNLVAGNFDNMDTLVQLLPAVGHEGIQDRRATQAHQIGMAEWAAGSFSRVEMMLTRMGISSTDKARAYWEDAMSNLDSEIIEISEERHAKSGDGEFTRFRWDDVVELLIRWSHYDEYSYPEAARSGTPQELNAKVIGRKIGVHTSISKMTKSDKQKFIDFFSGLPLRNGYVIALWPKALSLLKFHDIYFHKLVKEITIDDILGIEPIKTQALFRDP